MRGRKIFIITVNQTFRAHSSTFRDLRFVPYILGLYCVCITQTHLYRTNTFILYTSLLSICICLFWMPCREWYIIIIITIFAQTSICCRLNWCIKTSENMSKTFLLVYWITVRLNFDFFPWEWQWKCRRDGAGADAGAVWELKRDRQIVECFFMSCNRYIMHIIPFIYIRSKYNIYFIVIIMWLIWYMYMRVHALETLNSNIRPKPYSYPHTYNATINNNIQCNTIMLDI